MGDLKLQGSSGLFGKEQPIQHRKLPAGVDAKQIQGMTKGNNLDEIVVEDKLGDRHVVYADELSVKDGKMPKVGDKVNLAFLDDEVKVIQVDDEVNEDRTMAGMGVGFGLLGLAATRLLGGSASGNDTELKRFSDKADVSKKEMNWAKEMQDKSLKGHKPSAANQARFNDIMTRYAEQQKRENSPYQKGSSITQGELNWALQLEKKVSKTRYTPNEAETDRYQAIADKLRKETEQPAAHGPQAPCGPDATPAKVSQSDIDWALQLEKKVVQGYQPSKAEIGRYTQIAADLAKDSLPPSKGVTPQEYEWAKALQKKVETGYQPLQAEVDKFNEIATLYNDSTAAQMMPSSKFKPMPTAVEQVKPAARPKRTE